MHIHTQPSIVFDTTILENGVIQIPELIKWQNQDIHIVIVFKENKVPKKKPHKSLAGALKKYAKPELIDKETELAWNDITDN